MRNLISVAIVLIFAMFLAGDSFAHSGGTNANGCHTNRKTGDYHCHNSKPQDPYRQTYCHVLNGEQRCGYAKSTCDDLKRQYGGSCRAE